MYNIKKDVKVKDFNQETKDFLCKIGFTEKDDISELFKEYLEENELQLNSDISTTLYGKAAKLNVPLELPYDKNAFLCYAEETKIQMQYIETELFTTTSKNFDYKSLSHPQNIYTTMSCGGMS